MFSFIKNPGLIQALFCLETKYKFFLIDWCVFQTTNPSHFQTEEQQRTDESGVEANGHVPVNPDDEDLNRQDSNEAK